VPAPAAAIAIRVARRRRLTPAILAALGCLLAVLFVLIVGIVGAIFGLQPATHLDGYAPSRLALREIPARYRKLYQRAGDRYGIDPWILAGIGWVETMHGQSHQPGVRSGVNFAGCCAGPMQFNISNGPPSTWDAYGVDANRDGDLSPYHPADAIAAAARYLKAAGAPDDYRAALLAYNHADWYVDQVLAKASEYRGAARNAPPLRPGTASVRQVLTNARIVLRPIQRADLKAGGVDPRLVTILAAIGRRHTIVITALQHDHKPGTNHEVGRAIDIGAVDGEICRGSRTGACAELARDLAHIRDDLRPTELIYCFDPDGPGDPRGFAQSDHYGHVHVGWDA
jgi:hypothetical protein